MNSSALSIRRSPVTLAINIIVAEIILEVFYITSKLALYFLEQEALIQGTLGISVALNLLLLPIAIVLIIVPIAYWVSEEYVLTEEDLIAKQGIMTKKQTAYPYTNMQRIHVQQGVLGRMFNFGTISVYMPVLGQEIFFKDLSGPHGFAEYLKKLTPNQNQNSFLLRRT